MIPHSMKSSPPKEEIPTSSSPRDALITLMNAAYSWLEIRRRIKITWPLSNHVIFLKELCRLQKLYFLLKEYMDGYFWLSLEEYFLQAFFPIFFSSAKEKIHRGKKPTETQSMRIQVKSREIIVCKNVGKIMQNVGSRTLTPKSAKLTY